MVGEIAAFQCAARPARAFDEDGRLPAVAADQRRGDTDFAGLPRNRADIVVVAGNIENVRVGGFNRRQSRAEIRVAGLIGADNGDLAASLGEGFLEEILKSVAVVACLVV